MIPSLSCHPPLFLQEPSVPNKMFSFMLLSILQRGPCLFLPRFIFFPPNFSSAELYIRSLNLSSFSNLPRPPPPRTSLCSVLTFAHSSLLLDFGHFNCGLCPCIFSFVAVCARRGFQIRCSARISPLGLWVIDAQPTQGCVLLLCFIRLTRPFFQEKLVKATSKPHFLQALHTTSAYGRCYPGPPAATCSEKLSRSLCVNVSGAVRIIWLTVKSSPRSIVFLQPFSRRLGGYFPSWTFFSHEGNMSQTSSQYARSCSTKVWLDLWMSHRAHIVTIFCSYLCVCVVCVCVCVSALSLYGQMVAVMPSRTVAPAFESNFKSKR